MTKKSLKIIQPKQNLKKNRKIKLKSKRIENAQRMIKTLEENLNNLKENESRKNNTSLGTNKIPNNKSKILSINSSTLFKAQDFLEQSQLILDEKVKRKRIN